MLDWAIWYADGSRFDSSQGDPEDAPGDGVVCIVFPDPEIGCACLNGVDYYLWLEETETNRPGWIGVDLDGALDWAIHEARAFGALKRGRTLPRVDYHRIESMALDDPDFPRKTNTRADETRL